MICGQKSSGNFDGFSCEHEQRHRRWVLINASMEESKVLT